MKPYICTQCGGRINPAKMRCEYCGTQYELNKHDQIVCVETYHIQPVTLQATASYPKELIDVIGAADISREMCGRMATEIAEELTKYIDYQVQEDPYTKTVIARGRVRVLPPGYKF